jgi:hypothetical protein
LERFLCKKSSTLCIITVLKIADHGAFTKKAGIKVSLFGKREIKILMRR